MAQPSSLNLQETEDGVFLEVRAVPGASRERIIGLHEQALKIAVTAPAEKGKANKRILFLLAESLGLPRRCLRLASGQTSRDKRVLVTSLGCEELRRRLDPFL